MVIIVVLRIDLLHLRTRFGQVRQSSFQFIVVCTGFCRYSDNGGDTSFGGNNYPLRGGKSSLWEGGVRGVALVSGGEDIELRRGDVLTDLMHVTDWFPTLVVGVAGGNLAGTKKLDGVDQWKAIR